MAKDQIVKRIVIDIDSQGGAVLKEVDRDLKSLGNTAARVSDTFERDIRQMSKSIDGFHKTVSGVKGALMAGFGMIVTGQLTRHILETSNAFDQYRMTLETLEGSHKAATERWQKLLQFAQDTPFRIGQVMESYKLMRAYGLEPTIEAMRALGDTAAVMGSDALPRLALALGQIKGAGKVMMQDLLQLQNAGININAALKEAFGITRNDLEVLNEAIASGVIDVEDVYRAFIRYMQTQFGGQMENMMNTLKGQWEIFISHVEQGEDRLMKMGLGQYLTNALKMVNTEIDKLKKEGKLDEWAKNVSSSIITIFEKTALGMASVYDTFSPILSEMGDTVGVIWDEYKKLPTWAQEVGVIGAFVLGKKGAATLIGALTIVRKLQQWQDEQAQKHPLIASQLLAKAMQPGSGVTHLQSEPLYKTPAQQTKTQGAGAGGVTELVTDPESMRSKVEAVFAEIRKGIADINNTPPANPQTGGMIKDLSKLAEQQEGAKAAQELEKVRNSLVKLQNQLEVGGKTGVERQMTLIRQRYDAMYEEAKRLYETNKEMFAEMFGSWADFQDYWTASYDKAMLSVRKTTKDTSKEMSQFWIGAMRSMQSASSDFFMRIMQGNFKGLLSSFQQMINRMLADWAAAQLQMALWGGGGKEGLIMKAIGWAAGAIGGYFGSSMAGMASTNMGAVNMNTGAGWAANADLVMSAEQASFDIPWYAQTYHGGGIVGVTGVPVRRVPGWLFANAPRLHDGLKPWEYPAILRYGEEVRTPEQREKEEREKEPTEQNSTVINIYTLDGKSVEDVLMKYAGQVTASGGATAIRRF